MGGAFGLWPRWTFRHLLPVGATADRWPRLSINRADVGLAPEVDRRPPQPSRCDPTAEESHPGGYQVDLATVWNGSSQPEIAPPDAAGRLAPPASPRWRNALSHSTSQTVLRDLDGPADVSEWGRCPHVEHRVDTGRPRCRQSCRYFKRHEI